MTGRRNRCLLTLSDSHSPSSTGSRQHRFAWADGARLAAVGDVKAPIRVVAGSPARGFIMPEGLVSKLNVSMQNIGVLDPCMVEHWQLNEVRAHARW
jgi:hypothetical protein